MKFLRFALRLSLFANIVLFFWGWYQWQQRQRDAKGLKVALKLAQASVADVKEINVDLSHLNEDVKINSLRRTALEDQLDSAIEALENHVR